MRHALSLIRIIQQHVVKSKRLRNELLAIPSPGREHHGRTVGVMRASIELLLWWRATGKYHGLDHGGPNLALGLTGRYRVIVQ